MSFRSTRSNVGRTYGEDERHRQRLAGVEHEARQPRLTTKEDAEPDTKTRKRTEGAAAADRVMHNKDSSSAKGVDDGPTSLTSGGVMAESQALPCRDDDLVDKDAERQKPFSHQWR